MFLIRKATMISNEEIENIKSTIIDFFEKAGYLIALESNVSTEEDQEVLNVNIRTDEAQKLIGKHGLVLSDLQLLLRKIIKKKTEKDIYLNLDIDNYKRNKEDYLKNIAQSAADEAVSTGKEKELPLLSPFDRRLVHMELAQRTDVISESIGEGEGRRIVVKPIL